MSEGISWLEVIVQLGIVLGGVIALYIIYKTCERKAGEPE